MKFADRIILIKVLSHAEAQRGQTPRRRKAQGNADLAEGVIGFVS